ncbi:MAG: M23 family metallopeptidase [Deferrisomatales bacterium]
MRSRHTLAHAAALAVCFFALARPDRLWSSVAPRFEPDGVKPLLESLVRPVTPSLDEGLGTEIIARIEGLLGWQRAEGEIARGENLDQVLRRSGVEGAESHAFTRALRPVFDPRRARPGDRYGVLVDAGGRLLEFSYRRSPVEIYQAAADAGGWEVSRVEVPVERREVALGGRIDASLYESFLGAGADADLVLAFVELFSWDVDFNRETRAGDEFRVVYERLYARGEPVGNGRILGAEYRGERGTYTALYYRGRKAEGYFDLKGESVRKSFLRSPLKFTRVSSRFSRARRHPVLDIVRPHLGVDYAAPEGTPVWAVADGTVADLGWRGQAGKTVVLSHARSYETSYIHLSRYASGLARGSRVRQGQVIGYVGQTGLATGPHLDFRVKKNGQWVDPLKEKYVGGDPVPEGERPAYREWTRAWTARLGGVGLGVQTAQGSGR